MLSPAALKSPVSPEIQIIDKHQVLGPLRSDKSNSQSPKSPVGLLLGMEALCGLESDVGSEGVLGLTLRPTLIRVDLYPYVNQNRYSLCSVCWCFELVY